MSKSVKYSVFSLILFAIAALILVAQVSYAQGSSCTGVFDCTPELPTCVLDPAGVGKVCTAILCMQDSDCDGFDTTACVNGLCNTGLSLGAVVDAVVVTANDPKTGACEIGEIHPHTGVYRKMYDAGCSECGGLDTDDNGNLLVACGEDAAAQEKSISKRGVLKGKIREIDTLTGRLISANTHGVSNYMADVTVLPDCVMVSYETLDQDMVHKHDRVNNFLATPKGASGLDVERAGLASPIDRLYRTLATNVDGTPALYDIDPDTGEAKFIRNLWFLTLNDTSNTSIANRQIDPSQIQIVALDHISPASFFPGSGFPPETLDLSTRAGLFPIEDADYVVLLTKDDPTTGEQDGWAAFALVDHETGLVDRVIEIQSERDLQFTGLALKQQIRRDVPTLSEWGLVAMAGILGIVGFLAMRRRKVFE